MFPMNTWLFSFLLLTTSGFGQSIPDRRSIFILTRSLYTTDLLLRSADLYTTHRNMANPCRCFVEADPLAPKTSSLPLEAAFLYGVGLAIIQADRLAQQSAKPWLRRTGRVLLVADLISESAAIAHNNTQRIAGQPVR